jgi:hypothetical protein
VESIARYLEAIQKINEAEEELDQIVKALNKVAQALSENWATLAVVGVEPSFVPELPPGHEPNVVRSPQWPSIERIARALADMHRAYDAADAAWNQIEPEFRDRLAPPPAKFPEVNSRPLSQ